MRADRILRRVLIVLLLAAPMALAKEPKQLTELKAAYRSLKVKDEPARLRYVTRLTELAEQYLDDYGRQKDRGPQMPSTEAIDAVRAELRRHPMPATSDSKASTQLRVGDWNSPRHSYRYRRDGTWTMLPIENETLHGNWRIQGGQFFTTDILEPRRESRYTIILLDARRFVFADAEVVFFERRAE